MEKRTLARSEISSILLTSSNIMLDGVIKFAERQFQQVKGYLPYSTLSFLKALQLFLS